MAKLYTFSEDRMRQVGIVREVNEYCAVVEVSRKSACEGCHASLEGGCSACVSFGKKEIRTRADNSIGARVGDRVLLETDSTTVIIYALAVFLLPIVTAAVGYILLSSLLGELAGYITAVACFISVFAISCLSLNSRASRRFDVKIVNVL